MNDCAEFGNSEHRVTNLISNFVRSLPKSPYLENKISQVKLVKKYSEIPKGQSDFLPANYASSLPAFLNKSTLKTSKPVIFYLRYCENEFQDLLTKINKTLQKINAPLYKGSDDDVESDNDSESEDKWVLDVDSDDDATATADEDVILSGDFIELYKATRAAGADYSTLDGVLGTFFLWLAQQKTKDGQIWRWVSNKNCEIQRTLTTWPKDIDYTCINESEFVCTEYPSEMLKNSLGEPEAVVLKDKDLLIMLREFHKLVTK